MRPALVFFVLIRLCPAKLRAWGRERLNGYLVPLGPPKMPILSENVAFSNVYIIAPVSNFYDLVANVLHHEVGEAGDEEGRCETRDAWLL